MDGKEQGKDGEPAVDPAKESTEDSTETADKSDASPEKESDAGQDKDTGTSQNKESLELQVDHCSSVRCFLCYIRVACTVSILI